MKADCPAYFAPTCRASLNRIGAMFDFLLSGEKSTAKPRQPVECRILQDAICVAVEPATPVVREVNRKKVANHKAAGLLCVPSQGFDGPSMESGVSMTSVPSPTHADINNRIPNLVE